MEGSGREEELTIPERRKTREVRLGRIVIGGNNPIWVQSMTKTRTSNLEKLLREIQILRDEGCEIIRVSVLNRKDALVLGEIKKRIGIPLVADVHFNPKLAILAIVQGVDKVRINPGNIPREGLVKVVREAKDRGIPIRIGINSGSLEKDLLEKFGYPKAEAFVESALRQIELFESLGFYDIVVSLKSTDLETNLKSYRLFSKMCDYPLHLGITEAGPPTYGIVKSSLGIGILLREGIGDTLRVSLTDDPRVEVRLGFEILKATRRRIISPEVIACPGCGRIQLDLPRIVRELTRRLKGCRKPLRISILGCPVNGPGEAKDADIGLAGGRKEGYIFKRGKIIKKVKESQLITALLEEIESF
jgi:(E)-4-hydroxy-3-methylbut-2-enyl-diphosphate synthase